MWVIAKEVIWMGHINRTNEKYLVGVGEWRGGKKGEKERGSGQRNGEGKKARMLCDWAWMLRMGMLHRTLNWWYIYSLLPSPQYKSQKWKGY